MRKLSALLLALALLCTLAVPGALADRKIDSVAMLIIPVDGSTVVAGSAVCVEVDGTARWITATSALGDARSAYLMMEDMSYAPITAAVPLGDGLATELTLSGSLKASSVPLSTLSSHGASESCIGYLENAALLSTGAQRIAPTVYEDGTEGLTCTSMDGLLPGTALFDDDGALCGLITAALGEGEGRYIGIDAPALRAMLGAAGPAKPAAPSPADNGTVWIPNIPYSIDGTYLKVDLTGLGLEDQYVTVWSFESCNDYYRWSVIKPGEEPVVYFPAIPGVDLLLYAAANPNAEVQDKDFAADSETALSSATPVSVPAAGTGMPYGYEQECYLAFTPKDQAVGDTERLPAAEEITRAALTDPDTVIWLQVNCTYTVTEDIEDTLLCCVSAPDGNVAANMAGFIYGVDYMAQDDWHVDLTEEFRLLDNVTGLQGGTYTVSYYVGTVLAGSFTFTLPGDTVEEGGDSI